MIATNGEWLGNAVAMHTVATTVVPVADNLVGQRSFADAMRESAAGGNEKDQDVTKGAGEHVAVKSAVLKVPTRHASTETSKQLNNKNAVIADGGADNVASASDVVSKIAVDAPAEVKSDADDSPQNPVVIPSAMLIVAAITARIKMTAGQLIGEGKAIAGDASRAKVVAGKEPSHTVVPKESQVPANVAGNSAVITNEVSPQAASAPQVGVKGNAVAVSVEVKSGKKLLEQGATLPMPVASSAGVTTEAESSITDVSGTMSIPVTMVSANVTTEVTALHVTDMASTITMGLPIHAVSTLPGGTSLTPVKSEMDGTVAPATNHTQSEASGELKLNAFEMGKPGQLEVGVRGGEFGWLKVRAELGANGEVNAYLRGASVSTLDLLQTAAPRIETYLGTQDVAVRSVQVEAAHVHGGSLGLGLSTNGDAAAGGASQQPSSGGGRPDKSVRAVTRVNDASATDSVEGIVPVQLVSSQGNMGLTGTGNWLSVRA